MKFNRNLNEKNFNIKRGEIWYADLGYGKGSEQQGVRPVVIIQNDIGNMYSPTTTILTVTSKTNKPGLPTHVELKKQQYTGLKHDSIVLAETVRTIDTEERFVLNSYIGKLDDNTMEKIEYAMAVQLGLNKKMPKKNFYENKVKEKIENRNNLVKLLKYINDDNIKENVIDTIKIEDDDIRDYCRMYNISYSNKSLSNILC